MAKKAQMITVAAARRRERKIEDALVVSRGVVADRDAAINRQADQISRLMTARDRRGELLGHLAQRLVDQAADLKVIADVLAASGREDAEARLRSIAGAHEDHHRRIVAVLGGAGEAAMAVRRADADSDACRF